MKPRTRNLIVNLIMLALSSLSLFTALFLRFEFHLDEFFTIDSFLYPLGLLLAARQATRLYWDLNSISWRYFSTPDIQKVFKAKIASSLIFASLIFAFSVSGFPRSVLAIEFVINLMLDCGVKFTARLFHDWQHQRSQTLKSESRTAIDVLIVGAGYSAHLLVKTIITQLKSRYRPVACIDDLERLQDSYVYGVPVIGRSVELENVLDRYSNIKAVIVAVPSITDERFRQIEQICTSKSVLIKRVQSLEDIACLDTPTDDSQLSIEALLAKPRTFKYQTEIAQKIADQVVMVTGAGGSIGSEICRQLLTLGAKKVILFDCSEYNLYRLDKELLEIYGHQRIRSVIGSISDEDRLAEVMREEKPEILFHAAAYKHVPLMEFNAKEAFKNNVIGTRNVLLASSQLGVKRFVFISTDKAVDPSNIMGATKRLGELLVQEYARISSGTMQVAAVRFGNVINSAGSVIPLFKEQIFKGGPITVTHPEVERFFMSIPEAVTLVLTAGLLGDKGETFVLDMGKKLKVVDVAKRMLSLYGRRDIPIVFTGLRPGEKMTEELVASGEELKETSFAGVRKLLINPYSVAGRWNEEIENLKLLITKLSSSEFKDALLNLSLTPDTPLTVQIETSKVKL